MGKLLILENDPMVATLLREVFARKGHQVGVAGTGEEALARLGEGGVGVLITDLFLPGMDGLEVVERIAASGHRLPVVVVSGSIDPGIQARLERAPLVRGWLRKPFDLLDLMALVETAIQEGGSRDAVRPSLAASSGPR